MFQFPALPSLWLCVHHRIPAHYHRGVPAFGYPWFVGCLHLPTAFRSLPRPSSAPSAKASSLCSFLLNLFSRLQLKLQYILPFLAFIYLSISRFCSLAIAFLISSYYSVFKVLPSFKGWWAWEDSNLRPHAYQACALTT